MVCMCVCAQALFVWLLYVCTYVCDMSSCIRSSCVLRVVCTLHSLCVVRVCMYVHVCARWLVSCLYHLQIWRLRNKNSKAL